MTIEHQKIESQKAGGKSSRLRSFEINKLSNRKKKEEERRKLKK
jgi:hypothetical protein